MSGICEIFWYTFICFQPVMLYYSWFVWPNTEKENYDYVVWMRWALKVHMIQIYSSFAKKFLDRCLAGNHSGSMQCFNC